MNNTKLPMTEEEICRSYRTAKFPKGQVNILADLNVTDRQTIIDILYRHGELSAGAISAYIRHGQLPESARQKTSPKKPVAKEKKSGTKKSEEKSLLIPTPSQEDAPAVVIAVVKEGLATVTEAIRQKTEELEALKSNKKIIEAWLKEVSDINE